jgi:guanylate kinase
MSSEQNRREAGPRGELFILSGLSGTGKTTLIRRLLASGNPNLGQLEFSVSYTTRAARDGEVDGRDYHFVDVPTFEEMIAADRFLEWCKVYDQYKGTPVDEVDPRLESGVDVILDIDVQGAEKVLEKRPEAHSIFIIPPSYEDLERRLRGRAQDDEEQIARRLAVSHWEIERYRLYDYVIINDDAGRAGDALAAIFLEKRHRRERAESGIAEVLEGFRLRSEGV